jgi:sigma-B regulation protein RsbU (phosphoserine phosphatase)
MLLPAQKIPENLAYIMENIKFNHTELENFLEIVVRNNLDIFGSCIAFEPYAFEPGLLNYAPYAYLRRDSVNMTDLAEGAYKYRDWPWYRDPAADGPGWGEPYFDEGGGDIIMATYSVPFFDREQNHKFKGVVTVDISLQKLRRMIGNIKVYKRGYSILLSKKGVFIYHPDSLVVVKESIFSFARSHNLADLEQIGHNMVAGNTGFMKYYSLLLKEDCYLFHTSLKSNGWSLAMVIPKNEILADLHDLNRKILIIGISGFFAIFIIIIIISGSITRPLHKLVRAAHHIGKGNFDIHMPEIYSKDEIGQLADSFSKMQLQLREYIRNLRDETAARQKIESELKIAHDIQQGIIPRIFPPFPHRSDIDIHAALIPAREVGGDLYDYFFVEDDILAFVIGDVSGKGVPASLLMAITRTLFRSRTQKGKKVNEIMEAINSDLCIENENAMFVTLFLGMINLKSGEMEYCNAGHNYPFILHRNGSFVCLEQTHGTPVGLVASLKYQSDWTTVHKNDCLVLYTDGVTEAMNAENQLFGDDRLKNALENPGHGHPVAEVTNRILDHVTRFASGVEQSDDITILVLAYR